MEDFSYINKLIKEKAKNLLNKIKGLKFNNLENNINAQINFKLTDQKSIPKELKQKIKQYQNIFEKIIISKSKSIITEFNKNINNISENIEKIKENLENLENKVSPNIEQENLPLFKKLKKNYEKEINEIFKKIELFLDSIKSLFDVYIRFYSDIKKNIEKFEKSSEYFEKKESDKGFNIIYESYTNIVDLFYDIEDFISQREKTLNKWNSEGDAFKKSKKFIEKNIILKQYVNEDINTLNTIYDSIKENMNFEKYKKEIENNNIYIKAMKLKILFILDITSSMGKYLSSLKKNLKNIKDKIKKECQLVNIFIGFIGYKDFEDLELGDEYIDIDFSFNCNELNEQIKDVEVDGGGDDIPKDVAGAFQLALKKSWGDGDETNLAFLITNSPCHGINYHDLDQNNEKEKDNFPDENYRGEGGFDKEREKIKELVKKFALKKIHLVCLEIHKNTDKMFEEFEKICKEIDPNLFSTKNGSLEDVVVKKSTEIFINKKKKIIDELEKKKY